MMTPPLPGLDDVKTVATPGAYATQEDFTRLGLTYRQLDHWTTRGYLIAQQEHPGSGYERRWPRTELEIARTMRKLTAEGLQVWAAHYVARARTTLPAGDPIPLGQGVYIVLK